MISQVAYVDALSYETTTHYPNVDDTFGHGEWCLEYERVTKAEHHGLSLGDPLSAITAKVAEARSLNLRLQLEHSTQGR